MGKIQKEKKKKIQALHESILGGGGGKKVLSFPYRLKIMFSTTLIFDYWESLVRTGASRCRLLPCHDCNDSCP